MKKVQIYGERCSGTNYLEDIIKINFDVDITWQYGWKHFFGFQDEQLKNSDDTIFICIVRNLEDWINSFYRERHHLILRGKINIPEQEQIDEFLNKEFCSFSDNPDGTCNPFCEILEDRHIYTGERYKNIFELRHTKIKWMLEDLPNKVKNCVFIKYEDLISDFENTLSKIKDKGLKVKENINFSLNTNRYMGNSNFTFVKKVNTLPSELILTNPNLIPLYEKKLYNISPPPPSSSS